MRRSYKGILLYHGTEPVRLWRSWRVGGGLEKDRARGLFAFSCRLLSPAVCILLLFAFFFRLLSSFVLSFAFFLFAFFFRFCFYTTF